MDRYARLFEIPRQLSNTGLEISAICLSYQGASQGIQIQESNLEWSSYNFLPTCGWSYFIRLMKVARHTNPDAIIASSDVLHIIVGQRLASKVGIPFYADLYDNYEAFGMAKIPFLAGQYRRSLRKTDHIFTVTDALRDYVSELTGSSNVTTVVSTINPNLFFPIETDTARNNLQIDVDKGAILIGHGGLISRERGADEFFDAFERFHELHPNSLLYLAGTVTNDAYLNRDGVRYLGSIEHSQMNSFYNAMDINAIVMTENDHGKYAFPQKAYEIAASRKPCIAPGFGAMEKLFSSTPNALYRPGDTDSVLKALSRQHESPQAPEIRIPGWKDQAKLVRKILCGTE